jgi:hypothetical protein
VREVSVDWFKLQKEIAMRITLSLLSLCFAAFASYAVAGNSPSARAPAKAPVAAVADNTANACPLICGLGTLCMYSDGRCEEACNPCLCEAAGGTVVGACPSGEAPAPTAQRSFLSLLQGTANCA